MKISLEKENEDKVLQVSQRLDKSCTWIINEILKSLELENIEFRQELHINMRTNDGEVKSIKKTKSLKIKE